MWMERRIRNGETNVKGAAFHTALLAQVEAFDAGLEGKPAEDTITKTAIQRLAGCYEISKGIAGDVSPGELGAPQAVAVPFGLSALDSDVADGMLQDWDDLVSNSL